MIRTSRFLGVALLAALMAGLYAGVAVAQHDHDDHAGHEHAQAQGGMENMPPEMQEWLKYASPGEHHKHMDMMAGEWNVEVKGWQEGQEITSSGTSTKTWMLGGRYLHEMFHGEMMGMPFEGAGVAGFDNIKGVHCSVWMDNMSTGIMTGEGTCSEGGQVVTETSSMMDPMAGEMRKMKTVTRIHDKNKHVLTMYDVDENGNETKSMEITYTRKM